MADQLIVQVVVYQSVMNNRAQSIVGKFSKSTGERRFRWDILQLWKSADQPQIGASLEFIDQTPGMDYLLAKQSIAENRMKLYYFNILRSDF